MPTAEMHKHQPAGSLDPNIKVTLLGEDYTFFPVVDLLFDEESKAEKFNQSEIEQFNEIWLCFHKKFGLLGMKMEMGSEYPSDAYVTNNFGNKLAIGKCFNLIHEKELAILSYEPDKFSDDTPELSKDDLVSHIVFGLCKITSIKKNSNLTIKNIYGVETKEVSIDEVVPFLKNYKENVIPGLNKVSLPLPPSTIKPQNINLEKERKKKTPQESKKLKPPPEISSKHLAINSDNRLTTSSGESFDGNKNPLQKTLEIQPKRGIKTTSILVEENPSQTNSVSNKKDIQKFLRKKKIAPAIPISDATWDLEPHLTDDPKEEQKITISDALWPSDDPWNEEPAKSPLASATLPIFIQDTSNSNLQHILKCLFNERRLEYYKRTIHSLISSTSGEEQCVTLIAPLIKCVEDHTGEFISEKIKRGDPIIKRIISILDNILSHLSHCDELTEEKVTAISKFPFKEVINHATSKTASSKIANASLNILGIIAKNIYKNCITPEEGTLKAQQYIEILNNPVNIKRSNRDQIQINIMKELGLNNL